MEHSVVESLARIVILTARVSVRLDLSVFVVRVVNDMHAGNHFDCPFTINIRVRVHDTGFGVTQFYSHLQPVTHLLIKLSFRRRFQRAADVPLERLLRLELHRIGDIVRLKLVPTSYRYAIVHDFSIAIGNDVWSFVKGKAHQTRGEPVRRFGIPGLRLLALLLHVLVGEDTRHIFLELVVTLDDTRRHRWRASRGEE